MVFYSRGRRTERNPAPGARFPGLTAFIIVAAMAAIGLNTNLAKLVKRGGKPVLLGFIRWVVLALTTLAAQRPIPPV